MTLSDYEKRLQEAFQPSHLLVQDDSLQHQGHMGAMGSGPVSHLSIEIKAEGLDKLSKVKQHQAIYALFKEELASGALHALRINVL